MNEVYAEGGSGPGEKPPQPPPGSDQPKDPPLGDMHDAEITRPSCCGSQAEPLGREPSGLLLAHGSLESMRAVHSNTMTGFP